MALTSKLCLAVFLCYVGSACAWSVGLRSVGDMLFTQRQWLAYKERKMVADKSLMWPRNSAGVLEVPYKVTDPNVNAGMLKLAMAAWERETCVKFKNLPDSDTSTQTYMRIDQSMDCQAGVGYNQGEVTVVSLKGYACDYAGALHEIGHALGFSHEQAREDRDKSIIIVKENIKPGDEPQFTKDKNYAYGVPYDYLSIMQYEGRAAANDDKRVMLARDPRFQPLMGSAKALSFMDKRLSNIAYKCVDDWVKSCGKTADPCKNYGYFGKDCKCQCPPGTEGSNCEKLVMSYNDALIAKYGGYSKTITKPGTVVTTPGYPTGLSKGFKMVQVFQAPKCQRAVVTFDAFEIEARDTSDNTCAYDRLEIRDDITVSDGPKYCGTEIQAGQVFKSQNSMLIFHYYNYNYEGEGQENPFKGYKATFTTEPIPGC